MTPELVVHVIREALIACIWLCSPILLIAFFVGVVINIVQVATSMQDPSFSALPRLAAFAAGLLFLLPWMLRSLAAYTQRLFSDFAPYAR